MNQPHRTISVVMLPRGGGQVDTQALDSIFAQTLPAMEVIVVSDGDARTNIDRYATIPQLRCLPSVNRGYSASANFGVGHSHGDLIAILDQDDRWYPDHLAKLLEPFSNDPDGTLGWSYSNIDVVAEDGRLSIRQALSVSPAPHPKRRLDQCLGQDMDVLASASLISRAAFDAVGGFDETLRGYEDDDLFVRLFTAGYGNVYIETSLTQTRVRPDRVALAADVAEGRMRYVRKLLRSFPDDPFHGRFFGRDLIAPRFMHDVVKTARIALRNDDLTLVAASQTDIALLEGYLAPGQKLLPVRRDFLVTAVVALYNGGRFIETALRSVFDQDLVPDEVIVVDDGSTDNGPRIVAEMAKQYPIRLLWKANGGQSSARNLGVEHAHGDLIAFLDQDDIWYPNHLSELVKAFQQTRAIELGWAYSNLDEIDEAGNIVSREVLNEHDSIHPKRDVAACLKQDMFVLPSASVVSRKAFRSVGGFDECLSGYEDDDLFLRLLIAGFDNVYLPMALSKWRIHRTSSSYSPRMPGSRMYYARKLLHRFPDDPAQYRFYTSDLIAPRFMRQVVDETRRALQAGNAPAIEICLEELAFLESHMSACRKSFSTRTDLLITAIIPLYNGAAFIREALRSIIDQELLPDEIIVVDDGSTDRGPDIVRELAQHHPIRLLRKENGGQSSARNLGVDHAHGDLIAFLDQDDVWYPNHLIELIKPFQEARATELGWAYSNLDEISEAGEMVTRGFLDTLKSSHPKRDLEGCLKSDMYILPSASLIARKAFRIVGGFDERLSGYEDDDLFLRMFLRGFDNVYIPAALSKWRIYQASSSYSPRMAVSRAIFARKLINQFPDDPDRSRYNVRDLIAPRFFRTMAGEVRKAALAGNKEQQRTALSNFEYIIHNLRLSHRLPLQCFVLPVLRFPPLLRFIIRHRVGLLRTLRGFQVLLPRSVT